MCSFGFGIHVNRQSRSHTTHPRLVWDTSYACQSPLPTSVLHRDFYRVEPEGVVLPATCAQGEADIRVRIRKRGFKTSYACVVLGIPVGKSSQRTQHENQQRSSEQQRGALPPLESALRNVSHEARSHCSPEGRSSCRSRRHEPACQTRAALSIKMNNLPPQEGGHAW